MDHKDKNVFEELSQIETHIIKVWSQIIMLNPRSIDLSCSFFDMGGDSLKLSILINELWKEYEISFDLSELFESPTVLTLSRLVFEELKIEPTLGSSKENI